MWTYSINDGNLYTPQGSKLEKGYSGHGADVDVPADENQVGLGPIPEGLWDIGQAEDDPQVGPLAIPLTPQPGTETYGRSAFFIHGDEIGHVGQELASHGCIILPHTARLLISQSIDKVLSVVATYLP